MRSGVLSDALLFTLVVLFVVVVMATGQMAAAQDMTALTGALSAAEEEVRDGIFPAVAGVFGALVLIGVAAAVVRVITRGN
jgi:hypothetical protein